MPKTSTQLVGQSPGFRKALDDAGVAANRDAPVLVYGETGSGKGVLAEYIHRKSGRAGRLVSLNCASFQQNLFESELFGYTKGAFTGATKDTPGLFEAAQGGTLFLDEIGDTPTEIQPKLLRALEDGVVRRVGGTKEIDVDVRLVCATNRDLNELIAEGKFREDLFYRINSFVVTVPPLRERKEDLRDLAMFFLEEASDGKPHRFAVGTIDALENYGWPGNVRELRSAMEYAAAQAGDRVTITLTDLPEALRKADVPDTPKPTSHLAAFETLYRNGGESPRLWSVFLLKLHDHLGNVRFARGDMLECLRLVRGGEPTNNSLVNEWTRHIKPVPLRLGLIHEEGKKLRIDLVACNSALDGPHPDRSPPKADAVASAPRPVHRDERSKTNIPPARTSFIGRKQEHSALRESVASGAPNLITLTGPGGTGKTRLARELGRSMASELPGGTWFADLTDSRNIEGVAYAVAQALGVPLTGNQSPELAVGEILQQREPSLLILDNFEQVAEVAAEAVSNWAERAPQVRFLVTSRAILGIEGEREVELTALRTPGEKASLETITETESVQLFVERARVHNVGFGLDSKSGPAVAKICKRLEGMPLAIELAAARTVIMRPEQIAERMDEKFEMLKSSRRDLSPRQRSLQATIDWSYDLLNDAERWAFAQLSVFRGGFFLDAAESILDLSMFPSAPPAMDLIQGLREKSLLRALETPYETRFAMYQVIHEYATSRWSELADDAARSATQQRLAEYYQHYAKKWDARVHSNDAIEALDRLDFARGNFQAVLDWSSTEGASQSQRKQFIDISVHTYNLLRVRGPAQQRVPTLRAGLDHVDDSNLVQRARLLFLLSQAEREAGDPNTGYELAKRAVNVAEETGDENLIATAKFNLAGIEYAQENPKRAQELHREVLPIFQKLGNRANESRVLSRMALIEAAVGEFDEAVSHSESSEKILREMEDLPGLAFVLLTRCNIYNRHGQHEEALEYAMQAEQISIELDDKRMQSLCLGNRALLTRQLRRFDEAEELVQRCTELARELSDRPTLAKNLMNAGIMYVELARYDDAKRVLTEGEKLLSEQDNHQLRAVCIENLAYIKGVRGEVESALEGFERALSLLDDDADDVAAGIRTAMAEVLVKHERTDEATALAKSATEHWHSHGNPDHRDHFRALAVLAIATGDAAVAKDALTVATKIRIGPDDPSPSAQETVKKLKKISES